MTPARDAFPAVACIVVGLLVLGLTSVGPQAAASGTVPAGTPGHFVRELFFYPSFPNETFLHLFDADWIVKNATTDFPRIDEMTGIVVIIYWSQLCPTEGQCNFAMIDQILDFWAKLGKKVILCVPTTGAPLEKITDGRTEFVSATPDWVLKSVSTFQSPSNNFIGVYRDWRGLANNPADTFAFPRYDDPRFVAETQQLVRQLGARYDGNPAIAYVRIATGKSGEDNPYGRTNGYGPGTGMPGFTNTLWIGYSRTVADVYLASFHKTRLEFDMLWTTIVAAGAKTATPMTPSEPQDAQAFLDSLASEHVFLAFDGIAPAPTRTTSGATAATPAGAVCSGDSPRSDASTSPTDAAPYAQLARLKQQGTPFGLEGNGLPDPCEAPQRIRAILEDYRPTRVVFFGDAAALINFNREGVNDANRWEVDGLTSVFVPWTTASEFASHETQAMPRIKQFAAELDQLVRDMVVTK